MNKPCCYDNMGGNHCNCNKKEEKETMTFETWKYNGIRFLATPTGNSCNVAVMDETGKSYGAWYSVEEFRERQQKNEYWESIGTCMVRIIP